MISQDLADEVRALNERVPSHPAPAKGGEGWSERRACERRHYPTFQCVSPNVSVTPAAQSFYMVLCHDISTQGVSFFWPAKPNFTEVVMRMGDAPNWVYLKASVCHYSLSTFSAGHYLVGCRFSGRLSD